MFNNIQYPRSTMKTSVVIKDANEHEKKLMEDVIKSFTSEDNRILYFGKKWIATGYQYEDRFGFGLVFTCELIEVQ